MRSARPAFLAAAGAVIVLAGCDSARPIEQRSEASECARCHGFPPPPGIVNVDVVHPQNTECQVCHPTTVVSGTQLVEGGTHLNGVVDVGTGAVHAVPYPAHPTDALAGLDACAACHGSDFGAPIVSGGGSCNSCHGSFGFADWQTNCTFCHGTRTTGWAAAQAALPAPPDAVVAGGDQTRTNPKVGAHQAHLTPGPYANAFACSTCHTVPTSAEALTHFTGGGAPATVAFDALAGQDVASPGYAGGTCAVYCHGSGTSWPAGSVAANPTPAWTSTALACDACHASRPATGSHQGTGTHANAPCASCHLGYVQDTSVDPALHVNGSRSVVFNTRGGSVMSLTNPGWNCTTCHTAGSDGNVNAPVLPGF
jgi:predicted CxxxxCH...CXXCH cytochrome family protein